MADDDKVLPEQPENISDDTVKDEVKRQEEDPFICPDDEFLRSVWPPKTSVANLKNASNGEIPEDEKRQPLANFDKNITTAYCMGCRTGFSKPHYFWPTSTFLGRIHIEKSKPRMILCKKCAAAYYGKLLEEYQGDYKKALLHWCYDFDYYYDAYLVDKLMIWNFHDGSRGPNPVLKFPDSYMRILSSTLNSNPYRGKTMYGQITEEVLDLIVNGEYDISAKKQELEKEKLQNATSYLSKEDKVHRSKILATYLYDPFENYPIEERPTLYRSLYMMLDENIDTDLPRQRAALEIVTSYLTLEKLNATLQTLIQSGDTSKDAADNIAKWSTVCATKASIIEKQAKENGFSMRYAGSAGKGSGTLTGVQKELVEGFDDEILTNYYDIKTSSSIKHIADISSQSIIEQLELNENDYVEMIKEQRATIQRLSTENDKLAEELRLIKAKLTKGRLLDELKQEFLQKGIDRSEIDMILEDEYTVPPPSADAEDNIPAVMEDDTNIDYGEGEETDVEEDE